MAGGLSSSGLPVTEIPSSLLKAKHFVSFTGPNRKPEPGYRRVEAESHANNEVYKTCHGIPLRLIGQGLVRRTKTRTSSLAGCAVNSAKGDGARQLCDTCVPCVRMHSRRHGDDDDVAGLLVLSNTVSRFGQVHMKPTTDTRRTERPLQS